MSDHTTALQLPTQGVASIPSRTRPRFLVCTSLAQMAGIFADVALLAGGTVEPRDAFDPRDVLATIEREHITDVRVLPPLLYMLLDHPDLATADVSILRRTIYGGTAVSRQRLRRAGSFQSVHRGELHGGLPVFRA